MNDKKIAAFFDIDDLILDELHHYIELQHGKELLEILWDLSIAIREKKLITFDYSRMDKKQTKKEVKPAAIMFSEYYFYLISYGLNVEDIEMRGFIFLIKTDLKTENLEKEYSLCIQEN